VLLKAGDFKTGDVANFDRVTQGLERIRLAVRHAGYLEAKVAMDRKIDNDKKAVDVAVHIDAGPRFTMGKLNIVGLDLNGEFEIKRIWTMKEGGPFNADYPDLFLTRVREEGLFENQGKTKSEFKINDREHTADVTLTFAGENPEQKPGKRGRGRGADDRFSSSANLNLRRESARPAYFFRIAGSASILTKRPPTTERA
jgi:outer membrane protein assembly factor BamA